MTDTTYPDLLFHRDGEVAVLTLNVPERLNPLTNALQHSLCRALADLAEARSVRAVVLTGAGRAFCAGADLSAGFAPDGSGRSRGQQAADTMHTLTNRMVRDLRALPLPVVCAVNGVAAGGGLGLALAGDVVLAARSAYFYMPFMARLGIVPDVGSTWFYQRLLGTGRATALTLLADRLPAEKAAAWGLIWDCVDDAQLMTEAMAIARRLAALPAHAALETRAAFDAAAGHTLTEQLAYEAERQRELLDRPEFAEGVQAFLEKRAPSFAPR
ncbi:MAG: enoyl-CoA hydratase/isomerase family protein [Microbacteriaceae bacterium]|nr:enoyl-CoA hydratase/isomerase family protein [Burkholderiaceae bacterium]